MVFCVTRKSTVSTAKLLASWWWTKGARERQWAGPTFRLVVQDSDLKGDSRSLAITYMCALT